MSLRPSIGDVFEIRLSPTSRRFIQYVSDDATQLGSNVVRAFRETYGIDTQVEPAEVVGGHIDFHAHVFLKIGLQQKMWTKNGHAPVRSAPEVIFRDTNDYGNPNVKVSRNWHLWKINGPFEKVGELKPEFHTAEIGVVVPPDSLIFRMRNGRYDFVYPEF